MAQRKIRLGMVGGGQGAFIGAVHRIAARLDDRFELVAGCFSSDPARSAASGADLGLDPARVYPDVGQMAAREGRLKNGVEAVAIVTPNHVHADQAVAFLRRGIHVICDKPLTATLAQAKRLAKVARASQAVFALTHTYAGYPLVREARALAAAGELGELRVIQVEYAQDWLADPIEAAGQKQALWRTDPAQSGAGGAIGDIGTHALHLAAYVTGQWPEALSADLHRFVPGRRLDDNAHILLRYAGGARGMLWCSQVATGQENGLRLRVFGTKAALEWGQEDPNVLWVSPKGAPRYRLTRGGVGTGPAAAALTRVPAGHPEGYLEAFANLYAEAADAITARQTGGDLPPWHALPGLVDGLAGMGFVDAAVRSSARNGAWVPLTF